METRANRLVVWRRAIGGGVIVLIGTVAALRQHKLTHPPPDRSLNAGSIGEPSLNLPNLTRESSFDSLALADYEGFWRGWRLVTARYRPDNGEERFIYANEMA